MITKWKVPKYTQVNMEIYEKAGNSNQSATMENSVEIP